jgi:hypothetical protein
MSHDIENDVRQLINTNDQEARAVGLVLLSIVSLLNQSQTSQVAFKKELDEIKESVQPLKDFRRVAIGIIWIGSVLAALGSIFGFIKLLGKG